MKSKKQRNQFIKNPKNQKNQKNEEKEEISENIEKKEEIKENNKPKRLPVSVFLSSDLKGFHITFILMIIVPIFTFFKVRNILKGYGFTNSQQDTYGMISVLISVWIILIVYIVYYYSGDCREVCCKKKEDKEKKD